MNDVKYIQIPNKPLTKSLIQKTGNCCCTLMVETYEPTEHTSKEQHTILSLLLPFTRHRYSILFLLFNTNSTLLRILIHTHTFTKPPVPHKPLETPIRFRISDVPIYA